MNRAMKHALKNLPRAGAEVVNKDSRSIGFRMPDGSLWTCSNTAPESHVRNVVQFWADRAMSGDYLSMYKPVVPAPSIAGLSLRRTAHFAERCDLMTGQGMRAVEVRDALLRPTTVRITDKGTYLFCRDRIAVVVGISEGVAAAVTCLWTTRELWESNPREERFGRGE